MADKILDATVNLGNTIPAFKEVADVMQLQRKYAEELATAYGELAKHSLSPIYDDKGKFKGTLHTLQLFNKETQETVKVLLELGKIGKASLVGGSPTVASKTKIRDVTVSRTNVKPAGEPTEEELRKQARAKSFADNAKLVNDIGRAARVGSKGADADDAARIKAAALQLAKFLTDTQTSKTRVVEIYNAVIRNNKALLSALSEDEKAVELRLRRLMNIKTKGDDAAKKAAQEAKSAADYKTAGVVARAAVRASGKTLAGLDPKDALQLRSSSQQLQKYIADTGIANNRVAEIFKAIRSGNATVLNTLTADEQRLELRLRRLIALKTQADVEAEKVAKKAKSEADFKKAAPTAQRVVTALGRDIKGADPRDALQIRNASLQLQKYIADTGIANNRVAQIFNAIRAGNKGVLNALGTEERNLELRLRRLMTLRTKADAEAEKIAKKAKSAANFAAAGPSANTVDMSFRKNTKLGDPRDQLQLRNASLQLQKYIADTGIANTRVQQISAAIRSNNQKVLGSLSQDERNLEMRIRRLASAYHDVRTGANRATSVLLNFGSVVRLLEVQLLHKAITMITSNFMESKDKYLQLEKQIGLINTISQKARLSTESWASSLIGLSNSFGLDVLDVAAAGYEAISNQVAQGAAVIPFLAESFKFARTTASSAKDAVNLLSSALNAYNLGTQSTQRVAAILFKTIELGRVKSEEMANTFGNTARLASSLGIRIDELGAGLSTLTIQGIKYDTSATLMNNIILKLLKPTEAMKELFNEWGVSSGEAAVATFGFGGVLRRLNDEFNKGGLTRLGELEGDLRAIRAAAGLTASGAFDQFETNLKAMSSGLDEYGNAVEEVSNTLEFRLSKELNKLSNIFTENVGKATNETIYAFIKDFNNLGETVEQIGLGVINTVDVFARTFATLNNSLSVVAGLNGELSSVIPTVAAFAASAFAVHKTINLLTLAMPGLTAAIASMGIIGSAGLLLIPTALAAITWWWVSSAEHARQFSKISLNVTKEYAQALDAVNQKIMADADKRSQAFAKTADEQSQKFNTLVAVYKVGTSTIIKDFKDLNTEAENNKFAEKLASADTVNKLTLLSQRVKDLVDNSNKLTFASNFEAADESLKTLTKTLKNFKDEQNKIIEDMDKRVLQLNTERSERKFDSLLNSLADPAKIGLLQRQIGTLRTEAQQLFNNKKFDEGNEKLDTASKYAERIIDLTEKKKGNKSGFVLFDQVTADKIKAAEQLKKLASEDVTIATAEAVSNKLQEEIEFRKQIDVLQNQYIAKQKEIKQLFDAEEKKATDVKTKLNTATVESLAKATSLQVNANEIFRKEGTSDEVKTLLLQLAGAVGKAKESEDVKDFDRMRQNMVEVQRTIERLYQAQVDSKQFGAFNAESGNKPLFQHFEEANAAIKDMNKLSKEATDSQVKLASIEQQKNDITRITNEQVNELQGVLTQRFPETLQKMLTNIANPIKTFEDSTLQYAAITENLVNSIKASIERLPPGVGGRAVGGKFAGGGFLGGRYGRDNQIFAAHRGEFIVNAESAKNFAPQLVAMNSGGVPSFNNGGSITNVGGITINAQTSGNVSSDILAIGRGLEREINRGTINLNRRR